MYSKTIFFLVIDTTLASDNTLRFKTNFLERRSFIVKIDDTIRNEKLQYNIHREADFQQIKLINVNILQMQKYYILIKIEL